MLLSLIAAMANDRVIGLNNQMPWHMPADLAHFKQVTLGKPVVMGRKTFDSIGRLLPGRRNVVISRQVKPDGFAADWVNSLDDALALLSAEPEVMVIGGAGQEGGTTRGRREAMRQPAGREVPNRFDR